MLYKSGIEKIHSIIKNFASFEFFDQILIDDGRTGEYKVKSVCMIIAHNKFKWGEGSGIVSTHDSKMYYEKKKKDEIDRRFKTRGVKDPATGDYILIEELETCKDDYGNACYKVPKSVPALKELANTVDKKARIRAQRTAIGNAFATACKLKSLEEKYLAESGKKNENKPAENNVKKLTDHTCQECGKKLSEKEVKFSTTQCYKCQMKARAS
jgi:ribosomal protein L37AE/L43A